MYLSALLEFFRSCTQSLYPGNTVKVARFSKVVIIETQYLMVPDFFVPSIDSNFVSENRKFCFFRYHVFCGTNCDFIETRSI